MQIIVTIYITKVIRWITRVDLQAVSANAVKRVKKYIDVNREHFSFFFFYKVVTTYLGPEATQG